MVGTVDQGGFDTHHRESGQHTLLGTVAEAFFDRREEVLRHGTAKDGFCEDQFVIEGSNSIQTSPN